MFQGLARNRRYLRADLYPQSGSRFAAVVSVTRFAMRRTAYIGYLLIGTDNTARKQAEEAILKAGALQSAIFTVRILEHCDRRQGRHPVFNSSPSACWVTRPPEVMNRSHPRDSSDPQEVIARAKALSAELKTQITARIRSPRLQASRGIEDIYELTYIRKDGSRFPAVVSVTALRDARTPSSATSS